MVRAMSEKLSRQARRNIAAYWCEKYREAHRASYRFEQRDGAILAKLLRHYGDTRLRWMIRQFHQIRDDRFVEDCGHNTRAFLLREDKLNKAYSQHFEREGAREGTRLSEQLELLGQAPQLAPLVSRIGRDR